MNITIPPGETATIWLPGATAIRIDDRHRVIAVDTTSTNFADSEPLIPEWLVQDLREGSYGDFHQLKPADECFDSTCAGQGGQHATAEERAAFRDDLHCLG
jgi:hypothetical protein